jgi:cobalamin biosynthesis protein CobD/CbiB
MDIRVMSFVLLVLTYCVVVQLIFMLLSMHSLVGDCISWLLSGTCLFNRFFYRIIYRHLRQVYQQKRRKQTEQKSQN